MAGIGPHDPNMNFNNVDDREDVDHLEAELHVPGQLADEIRSIGDPRIGQPIDILDTPALLLDRRASDDNLHYMAEFFDDKPAMLRPHFKNHKCVTLAKRQLAMGAVGMTCAKLAEAEVLAAHGVTNLLVANQIVGKIKMQRLARLATVSTVGVAVDCESQVAGIPQAGDAYGGHVNLLIEVDIGMGRCGLAAGKPILELAKVIQRYPGVSFDGLQAFEGHLVNVLDRDERRRKAHDAMMQAVDTMELLQRNGIAVNCISGSSSSTYDVTGVIPGVTEVQAGTYATMDRQYHRLAPEFKVALSILVQVISRPTASKAVLDLGVKGAGGEFGVPEIPGFPDVKIPFFLSEEHLVVHDVPEDWQVGQTLQLVPGHACTTCNLYRELVIHQDGRVVDVWPIEASGLLT